VATNPLTKYLTLAVVTLQFLVAIHLRSTPFFPFRFLLTAYLIVATANQNLFLAIHEIGHNLALMSPLVNRDFAVFANLPRRNVLILRTFELVVL